MRSLGSTGVVLKSRLIGERTMTYTQLISSSNAFLFCPYPHCRVFSVYMARGTAACLHHSPLVPCTAHGARIPSPLWAPVSHFKEGHHDCYCTGSLWRLNVLAPGECTAHANVIASLFLPCASQLSRSAGGDALLVVFAVAVFNSVAAVLTIIERPLPSGWHARFWP